MASRYSVLCADMHGEHYSREWATLDEAIADACRVQRRWPDDLVQVSNPDRVDLGCADGLTADEAERVEDAMHDVYVETRAEREKIKASRSHLFRCALCGWRCAAGACAEVDDRLASRIAYASGAR